MRIALISDIHGNTVALDAVLADIGDSDLMVCLGDIASGGPDPNGAVERIAELGGVAVRGNTDMGMVDVPEWWRDPSSVGLPEDAVPGLDISVWSAEQLTAEHLQYLAELPPTATIGLGTVGGLLAFHGSPRSADDLLTAATPNRELDEMFEGVTASVLVGGHTHVPLVRRYGTKTILNPGSVGLPFAEYGYAGAAAVPQHAAYAVLLIDGGTMGIELRQAHVDHERLRKSVARSHMPHADWWLGLRS